MAHWGWYWRIKKKHVAKTVCTKLISIDSFKIVKNGAIFSFSVQPFEVKATPSTDHLKITYRGRKDFAYEIPIDKLPCNYGGIRCYFKCPLCSRRMRILYFAEQSIFLCRICLNLGYESQRLRPSRRYAYMSEKVKTLVKNKGGDLGRYKKPPRMHKDNYQALRSKQFYYESKSYQAMNHEFRKWYSPKTLTYIDEFFDYVDESKEWRKQK